MKKTDSLRKLASLLETIQDTALQIHEGMEKNGEFPLLDFERCILPDNRRFDSDVRASILWFLLLFTKPRIASQKAFQTTVMSRLPSAESSLIVRQILCRPMRVWSYRTSYKHGFAHTIAGPHARCEISINACLRADGSVEEASHLYAFGWTVSFEENIFLICASGLSQDEVYTVETTKPFPMPLNDDDFWEESIMEMIRRLYEPLPMLYIGPPTKTALTDDNPDRRFSRLNRIIAGTMGSEVVRSASSLQITVATKHAEAILAAVDRIVATNLDKARDPGLGAYLQRRILEAVGCDENGNMPHAHTSLLTADPVALLLLPSELAMFSEIGPRDSIRQALAYDEQHGTDDATKAFAVYQRERRWLCAFPCFDFSLEEHASRFGIPADAIQTVFAPELMNARLPMAPQGDALRQLQNKFGLYQPDAEQPTFQSVLKALTSRSFQRNGNMANVVQWLISCCDRWRYCLCEIEPDTTQRTVSQANQKLLQKGLRSLSDMFKKK